MNDLEQLEQESTISPHHRRFQQLMDETIKSQWIAALRSGDYKQGRNVLRQDDAYCCLGVLCDLHSKAHPENLHSWCPTVDCYENCYSYNGITTTLPNKVQDWAGLFIESPEITVVYSERIALSDSKDSKLQHVVKSLAELNDQGYTFAEIAQLIDDQL